MSVAYVHPECAARGCWLGYRRVSVAEGEYQHGDNPEAILRVPTILPSVPEPSSVIRAMFNDWVERVHRYEDGISGPIR